MLDGRSETLQKKESKGGGEGGESNQAQRRTPKLEYRVNVLGKPRPNQSALSSAFSATDTSATLSLRTCSPRSLDVTME